MTLAMNIRLYECSFSPRIISQSSSCSVLAIECPPLTKKVITQIPGVCCPNVSCVNTTTCEVNEITYNVGDKIPHEDPCFNW